MHIPFRRRPIIHAWQRVTRPAPKAAGIALQPQLDCPAQARWEGEGGKLAAPPRVLR